MSKMSEENAEVTTEVEAPAVEEVVEGAPKSRRSRKSASEEVAEEAPAVEAPAVEEAPAPVVEVPAPVAEAPAKAEAPEYPAMALTSGAASGAIVAAQKKLGVTESGVVDAETKSAVKACQKKAGLKADGTITKNTWNAIFA